MAVARGCGSRIAGGLYLETLLGPSGRPVTDFLMDPVRPLPTGFRPPAIGVSFVEHPRTGVVNVLDWVGAEHYPNVADLVEEVRRFGLSRRISTSAPIGRLTPESRVLLVHGRAFVANYHEYVDIAEDCPKVLPGHAGPVERIASYAARDPAMCCGLWWDDVDGGEPTGLPEGAPSEAAEHVARMPTFARQLIASAYEAQGAEFGRDVLRSMPSFKYRARRRPQGVKPAYQAAIFAAFPISQLTVITDPVGKTHERALRAAEKAGIWFPVVQEDE